MEFLHLRTMYLETVPNKKNKKIQWLNNLVLLLFQKIVGFYKLKNELQCFKVVNLKLELYHLGIPLDLYYRQNEKLI